MWRGLEPLEGLHGRGRVAVRPQRPDPTDGAATAGRLEPRGGADIDVAAIGVGEDPVHGPVRLPDGDELLAHPAAGLSTDLEERGIALVAADRAKLEMQPVALRDAFAGDHAITPALAR